jgi:alcohol dehydrogenase class IV
MAQPPLDAGRPFIWRDGERLVRFGVGVLAEAPALLEQRGFADFALLTTPRALAGSAAASSVAERAGVVLHVPSGPVPEASAEVRGGVGGRPLVALGGGRVVDSTKAIAGADGLECAALPTTLSGAPMTPFHRMPDGVEEWSFVRPSLVVAEPDVMASQPHDQLAATAMNALAHAVEALYAPGANPVAEMAALRAAELFAAGLPAVPPDRDALALAALLGGYAVGSAGLAIHHAVCQTIVRVCGTPHAETNAVMLPRFVAAMADRAPREIGALAEALGAEAPEPESAAPRVAELAALSGATALGQLGVQAGQISEIVSEALAHPAAMNTPRPFAEEELTELLESAL